MFMSWNLYFANWKRTETMSLLIKIASLLIGNCLRQPDLTDAGICLWFFRIIRVLVFGINGVKIW